MNKNERLAKLEEILNTYGESLKINSINYKSTPDAIDSISRAWYRCSNDMKPEIINLIMQRSCFDCKYFDGGNTTCMYKCALRAIFDIEESASECEHYVIGTYNQEELEKTNYI